MKGSFATRVAGSSDLYRVSNTIYSTFCMLFLLVWSLLFFFLEPRWDCYDVDPLGWNTIEIVCNIFKLQYINLHIYHKYMKYFYRKKEFIDEKRNQCLHWGQGFSQGETKKKRKKDYHKYMIICSGPFSWNLFRGSIEFSSFLDVESWDQIILVLQNYLGQIWFLQLIVFRKSKD